MDRLASTKDTDRGELLHVCKYALEERQRRLTLYLFCAYSMTDDIWQTAIIKSLRSFDPYKKKAKLETLTGHEGFSPPRHGLKVEADMQICLIRLLFNNLPAEPFVSNVKLPPS